MHNKFTIIDEQFLETGSFNYTYNATKINSENQVYLDIPKIVLVYVNRFNEIWTEAVIR